MAAARFLVSGKVQGVFFRACARDKALELGLSGNARNLPDGRVEVLATGQPDAIDAFGKWLWTGSPPSRVERVVREAGEEGSARGFDIG